MLKNDTLKNCPSRIGLYGGASLVRTLSGSPQLKPDLAEVLNWTAMQQRALPVEAERQAQGISVKHYEVPFSDRASFSKLF